ncbi:MAG: hypothetical protein QNJ68_23170 [Microcoleaceae cyanobacterium MO_207.B10]|nr:hypothetical protein [Microcoleaceae cyanobacterium MO_207.B10]
MNNNQLNLNYVKAIYDYLNKYCADNPNLTSQEKLEIPASEYFSWINIG